MLLAGLACAACALAPAAALALPPEADFTVAPEFPLVGQPATFTSTSTDPEGDELTVFWNFGDGVVVGPLPAGQPVMHTYDTPGPYNVTLSVFASDGVDSESQEVIVGPPTADFTFSPVAPRQGQVVQFDASASTDSEGPIAGYAWDFDNDGDFDDATGVNPTRTFPVGSFLVRLQVTDSDGATDVTERTVVVRNVPPLASFFAAPRRPAVNEVIQLTSTASDPDGSLVSQTWDLDGDGAFDDASGQVAFTVFTSPGSQLIGLRVVDNTGAATISRRVLVVGGFAGPQLSLLRPFPVVRLAGELTRRGARVRILSVTGPAGSRVVVRCRGRLCPRRRATTRLKRTGRPVRIRRFQRRLQAGVVLEVLVSRPGTIGKYTRFRIRRGKAPKRRDGCLMPGSTRLSSCPDS